MPKKASIAGAVVAGFPSPAEQYLGAPLEPANPDYPTITVRHGQELLLYGKVTAVIHQL